MILYIVCLKFILKSCFSHTLLNMYVSCSTKCGEHTWQSLICHIAKHVWTVESFFASNRSHTELAKSNTEEEQCINQEETGEEQRKQKKSLNSPKTWLRDHTWLHFEKEAMFCYFCWESKKTNPSHRQKGVQILEPKLCKDIKTVQNMRMLLIKKLRGIHSATHSAVFLENNRKGRNSNESRLLTGQGGHSHSQVWLTAQFSRWNWPRKC